MQSETRTQHSLARNALLEPPGGVPDLIDTPAKLAPFIAAMRKPGKFLAVDTERADGIRYQSRAQLVQIRGSETATFLIDPINCPDFSQYVPTGVDVTWVLHAANEDLPCLKYLNLQPTRIFDTQIAVKILGHPRTSLGDVTADFLHINLAKNHSHENWSQRPLPHSWLGYAALDVEFLPQLAEKLTTILQQRGRLSWLEAECEKVLCHSKPVAPPNWTDLKGATRLTRPQQREAARRLFQHRDKIAAERDLAVHRVLKNQTLLALAIELPRTLAEAKRKGIQIPGKYPYQQGKWIRIIRRARQTPPEHCPAKNSKPKTLSEHRSYSTWVRLAPQRAKLLQLLRQEIELLALENQVAAELLCPAATRRQIAATFQPDQKWQLLPAINNLSPWQQNLLAPVFEQLAIGFPPHSLEPVSPTETHS